MSNDLLKVREQIMENLERTEAGTDEHERLVDDLIKIERLQLEAIRTADETCTKVKREKRDIIDLVLKHALTALGIGVTTFTTIFLFGQGMQFEKEDTFRSTTMRNFMSKNFFKLKNW